MARCDGVGCWWDGRWVARVGEFSGCYSGVLLDDMFVVNVGGVFCAMVSAFDVSCSIILVSKWFVKMCK